MRPQAAVHASILLSVAAALAQIVAFGLPGDARIVAASSAPILAGVAAALAMLVAGRRVSHARVRRAWLFWSAAAGFWVISEIARSAAAATGSEAASSAALLCVILFGILAIAGFAERSPDGALSFRLFVIDAAPVVILAASAASIVYLDTGGFGPDLLLIPSAAVSSLAVVVALQLLLNWRTASMLRVTAGFSLLGATELARALHSSAADFVNPAWAGPPVVAGLLALVLAGVIRARAPDRYTPYFALDRDNGLRWLPAVAGVAGIVALGVWPLGSRHAVLLDWSLAAAMPFLTARFVLVQRASERMLDSLDRSREALRNSEGRYRDLFENAHDIVFTTDLAGNFTSINRAGVEMMGYTREEIVAMNLADLAEGESLERARAGLRGKLAGAAEETVYELEFVTKGARRIPFELSTRLVSENGEPVAVQGIGRDASERRAYEQDLQRQVLHDSLTGLANRDLFADRIEHALARRSSGTCSTAVLFLDLDGFKAVNDTFGHQAGDLFLVEIAVRLRSCLRSADTCARLGGDEFAILLEESSVEAAAEVADRILAAFRPPVSIGGQEVFPSVSIGVVLADAGESGDVLLRNADVAMYEAKASGGKCHVLFEAATPSVASALRELASSP